MRKVAMFEMFERERWSTSAASPMFLSAPAKPPPRKRRNERRSVRLSWNQRSPKQARHPMRAIRLERSTQERARHPDRQFRPEAFEGIHLHLFQDIFDWAGADPDRRDIEERQPIPVHALYRDRHGRRPSPSRAAQFPASARRCRLRACRPARSWATSTTCIRFAKAMDARQMLYLGQLASAGRPQESDSAMRIR